MIQLLKFRVLQLKLLHKYKLQDIYTFLACNRCFCTAPNFCLRLLLKVRDGAIFHSL